MKYMDITIDICQVKDTKDTTQDGFTLGWVLNFFQGEINGHNINVIHKMPILA